MEGYTSGHAVLELYAVMTRLPRSQRMLASQAMVIIQENILKKCNIVALSGKEYGELVLNLGIQSALGGQAYDALHLACARKCDAERVYTFNVQHFQNLVPDDFRSRIVAP
jgi:predicted nucleic acid-binding protein